MLFVHKSSPHRFPFLPSSPKSPPASLARPFEDALVARLVSLLPVPESSSSPSLALSWLANAARLLALVLSDAAALLPDASSSDRDVIAAYLDSGVALLDACNAASAEIDRLLRRRLHLRLALHLLASSDGGRNPDKMRRARDSLAEWRASPRLAIEPAAADLARSLSPADPPRGKESAVRRAIYAVDVVSGLIAGAVVAVLGGGGGVPVAKVSADFPWAEEYNKVAAVVSHKLGGGAAAAELDAVEAAVKKLTDVIDGPNGDGDMADNLHKAATDAEKATDALTEGLDALSSAVNGLFHSALGLRNTALQGFRFGPRRCK